MSHTLSISFPFNSTSLRPSLPCYCSISHSLWFLQTRGRQYWATPFCITTAVVRIEFRFRLLPYLQQVATMLSISIAALFEYCCATHTLAAIKLLLGVPFWHQTRTPFPFQTAVSFFFSTFMIKYSFTYGPESRPPTLTYAPPCLSDDFNQLYN